MIEEILIPNILMSAIMADACLFFIATFFAWRYPDENITHTLYIVWSYATVGLFILLGYNLLMVFYKVTGLI